jgi:hypothetical protein
VLLYTRIKEIIDVLNDEAKEMPDNMRQQINSLQSA